jgi:hypothetical protein
LFTELKNPRSIAYLTSADVTFRLTGGENWTPRLSATVTRQPSAEMAGRVAARSGSTAVASSTFGR